MVAKRDDRQEKLIRLLEEALDTFTKFKKPLPMLLSYKRAAQELGVGSTKLKALVRQGKIIPSTSAGRKMIAATELQRFSQPGVTRRPSTGRPRLVVHDGSGQAQRIRERLKKRRS